MAKEKKKGVFGPSSVENREIIKQTLNNSADKIVEGITHLEVSNPTMSFADMSLSLFQQVVVGKGMTNQPKRVSLQMVYEMLRYDQQVKETTAKYRAELPLSGKKGKKCKSIKDFEMPACSVACLMEGGTGKRNCIEYTEFTIIDLDDYALDKAETVFKQLKSDPYVVMLHHTPSGGLRALVYVEGIHDEATYTYAWRKVSDYFQEKTGIPNDESTKNINRLSVICHDPDAILRTDAVPFPVDFSQMPLSQPKRKPGRPAIKKLEKAWELIKKRLEREGMEYTEGQRNAYIVRVAYMMNEYGIREDTATTWAVSQFSDYSDGEQGVRSVFKSCYAHTNEFGTREVKDGGGVQLLQGIQESILRRGNIRYNSIKAKEYVKWTDTDEEVELTNRDINKITHNAMTDLDTTRDLTRLVKQEIGNPDFVPEFNPLQEYIYSLPKWNYDDPDYISQVAEMVTVANNDYAISLQMAFKKWTVNVVACMLNPGTKNEGILTFVGPQNCGKTTFFENLFPPELNDYTTTQGNISFQSKDERALLCENVFILLDELDHINPRMFELVKSSTSTTHITDRLPYDSRNRKRPRIASFAATGNNTLVLPEGNNRRWFVYEVTKVSEERFHIPHAGLFAQAYTLLQSGFDYRLTEEEVRLLEKQNEQFRVPDLIEEAIRDCFKIPEDPHSLECGFFSASEVLKYINASHQLKDCSAGKIGNTLKRMGCKRVSITGGRKGYKLILLPPSTHTCPM